jgi:hypothetical protein
VDALPLGLLVGLLGDSRDGNDAEAAQLARVCMARLEGRLGGVQHPPQVLRAWAVESESVVAGLLDEAECRPMAERLLVRADLLLSEVQAVALADRSEVLPAGLTRRLVELADALLTATRDADAGVVSPVALARVERAWEGVASHRLASRDRRTGAFLAAVRVARWLSLPDPTPEPGLNGLVARHCDIDAWVDSAVNDAARGVGEPDLGSALAAILHPTRNRRAVHDTQFATALVAHTADDPPETDGGHRGVAHLEDLLPLTVLPLARTVPVLLLVLDGMSVGVAHEVMSDVLSHGADAGRRRCCPVVTAAEVCSRCCRL